MGRVIHKFFLVRGLGVHFSPWKEPVGGDVHCCSAFRLHSEHVLSQVSDLCTMLSQEPCRARCANETISGRESLARRGSGLCDPIEEQDLSHSASTSGCHPTLALGLVKGGAGSRSLSSAPHSSLLVLALRWLLLVASALCCLFTRGWCATETCLFQRTSAEHTLPRAPAK